MDHKLYMYGLALGDTTHMLIFMIYELLDKKI